MIKLHRGASASYAAFAKQIAEKEAEVNKRYEHNMLFPEQNDLVYVEISPCPIHSDLY